MNKKNNIKIGQNFGRWTVIEFGYIANRKNHYWLCKCECGNIKNVFDGSLKFGRSKSCGCLSSELSTQRFVTHGMSDTATYHSWSHMRSRCRNPDNLKYKNYGGRGIKICARWSKFANFIKDMGEKPGPQYSIDRIDNNGNYCKTNCRWATFQKQARNTRQNRIIKYGDKKMCVAEWSDITNICSGTIRSRLLRGWSIGEALGFIERRKHVRTHS